MIEVHDLKKNYGPLEALRGVSFTVQPGEVVGLLGPNGAGKSTFMRIATGYVAASSGVVTIDGVEVLDDLPTCQRKIGYLPEGNPLYLHMRLRDALRFAANARGLHGSEREQAIREAIVDSGLRGKERKLISSLSRGFRQRVGLAMALLHRPPILILDEPSSGLDPNQQTEMRRFIRRLGESRTIVFSTHILPEVEAMCDRVLILDLGDLVADGTVEEIRAMATPVHALNLVVKGDGPAVRKAFESLPFAAGLETSENAPEPGLTSLVLSTTAAPGTGTLEMAADAAFDNGLRLLSLEIERPGLDDAFAQLTGKALPGQSEAEPAAVAAADAEASNGGSDDVE